MSNYEKMRERDPVEEVQKLERKLLGWGVTLLAGIVGSAVVMGSWVGSINTRVSKHDSEIEDNRIRIETVINSNNDIKVQLARIEATLVEIQKKLEHQ